jgi:hypothetical protein
MIVVALVVALLFGLTLAPGAERALLPQAQAANVVMINNVGQIPQPNLGITLQYWPAGTRISVGYVVLDPANGLITSYVNGTLPNGRFRSVYVITQQGKLFYIRVL